MKHVSVLLKESIEGLDLKPGQIFLDGTLGAGGHSRYALELAPGLRVIGLDQDPTNVERVARELEIEWRAENFANLDKVLTEMGIQGVDAILLDLGFSSDQLEEGGRGLSFLRDEPLDMRLSGKGFTAADILNSWDESAIELILKGFGEERHSRRIAAAIAATRKLKPFETTGELVTLIESVVPGGYHKIHPATRTFQALRIAVNEELPNFEKALVKGFAALKKGGRMAIISFHSLEDRIVKNFFRDRAKDEEGELMNKKPIVADEAEVKENPRSRSAKLRIIKKL